MGKRGDNGSCGNGDIGGGDGCKGNWMKERCKKLWGNRTLSICSIHMD